MRYGDESIITTLGHGYYIRIGESIAAPANMGNTGRVVRGTKAAYKGVVRVVVTQVIEDVSVT